jgi:hypothetical protein
LACFSATAALGLERPEDGDGEVFPEAAPSALEIAFTAATLLPAAGVASLAGFAGSSFLGSSFLAAGTPIDKTFAFGAGASPPMLRTLGPVSLVVTGLFNVPAGAVPTGASERFAMVGT